jgi:uncharacterized protein
MIKENVTFKSEKDYCAGWLFIPDNLQSPAPAIVMAHGFSLVKEAFLQRYAEYFCENGFIVLVFDYRYFGESGGEPRQHIEPYEQIKDYRNAITWIRQHELVDDEQIGIWGTSYSGGHVLHVASVDHRVKAVVAQVPTINGRKGAARKMGSEQLHHFINKLERYKEARYLTDDKQMMAVVSKTGPSAQPHPDAYDWFMKCASIAPTWKNEITLESMEHYLEYNPASFIEFIAPTPLLMIAAMEDGITPPDLIIEAYEEWANEPKHLLQLPGGHFDVYDGFTFEAASEGALQWFVAHLMQSRVVI